MTTSIETPYGPMTHAFEPSYRSDGTLDSVTPSEPCELSTPLGRLAPQHSTDDVRRKTVQPVCFHRNGRLKTLPLETQTILPTPAGPMPAELVTFHDTGEINRLFPLNGKLTGYWSQEDEASLAKPIQIQSPLGRITARFISLSFHPGGAVKSLTLWPGETLEVNTPLGPFMARNGVSFHKDGRIASMEPAEPTPVKTPAGEIHAFDPDAVGINGDTNSLAFDATGSLLTVTTVSSRLLAMVHGVERTFTPATRPSLCSAADSEPVPMTLTFSKDQICILVTPDGPATILPLAAITNTSQINRPLQKLCSSLG